MKLRVGDKVKVTNWGKSYSSTVDWFVENTDIPRGLVARYTFGDDSKFRECRFTDASTYTVEYLDNNKALISEPVYGLSRVYLIGVEGLQLANAKKMTVSEIEEALGYRVEIIAEDED